MPSDRVKNGARRRTEFALTRGMSAETLARMLRGPRDDEKWRRVSEGLAAKRRR